MNCIFEHEDGWCVCKVCGYSVKTDDCSRVFTNCPGKPTYHKPKEPSFMKKAITYTRAVLKNVSEGMPTRTDAEVDSLLAICQSCEKYNSEKEYCTLCGCKCNAAKIPFINKLRMSTEHCKLEKW